MDKIIELDVERPEEGDSIFRVRNEYSRIFSKLSGFDLVVLMVTWNSLEKTKLSVESLLKYTSHISFQLVFFDNGSQDDTINYLKSVKYPNKVIIQSKQNLGVSFAYHYVLSHFSSEFFLFTTNDCIVTKGYFDNMMFCMNSDDSIGMVVPATSNLGNEPKPDLEFSNLEEMQEKAILFNQRNPRLWRESKRLYAVCSLVRSSAMNLSGGLDPCFLHNFLDNEWLLRFFRSGYQQILCMDTFVHHNHTLEERNLALKQQEVNQGAIMYKEIHQGLNGFQDSSNYETNLLKKASYPETPMNVLGVNVLAGTPLLEIRNSFRERGNEEVSLFAYTTKAMYFLDLQIICENKVACDRIMYLSEHYQPDTMDCILAGEGFNHFPDPMKVLADLLVILKQGGQLLFKWHNFQNIFLYIQKKRGEDVSKREGKPNFLFLQETCETWGLSMEVEECHFIATEETKDTWLKEGEIHQDLEEHIKEKLFVENFLIRIVK